MTSVRSPGYPALLMPLTLSVIFTAGACATAGNIDRGGKSVADRSYRSPELGIEESRFFRIRGVYRGTVIHQGKKNSFRQVFALEPPDRVRVEMLGPMGNPRLILAFDGRGAVGMYPRDKIYFQEEFEESAFVVFLGIPLAARELVPLLTGEVFYREPDTRIHPPVAIEGGWRTVVSQAESGLHYVVILNGPDRRVLHVDLHRGDPEKHPPFLTVDYPAGTGKPLGPIPPRWEMYVPGANLRLAGTLIQIQWEGVEFPEDVFQPRIPDGFRRVAAGDLAADRPLLANP